VLEEEGESRGGRGEAVAYWQCLPSLGLEHCPFLVKLEPKKAFFFLKRRTLLFIGAYSSLAVSSPLGPTGEKKTPNREEGERGRGREEGKEGRAITTWPS
jgi:hypothetical protein